MTQSELDTLRHRAEAYLKEDPRVRRWRIRTDGAIALEIIVQGAVPPQDRFQIVEALGKPLYRIEREEGALDALLDDLVVVRVDVDGIQPELPPESPDEHLAQLNHRFWVDVWVTYGFLNRGRTWKAIKQLADLRQIVFDLAHMVHDPSLKDEEVVPEELRGALARTSPAPEALAIGQALLYTIFVYRRVRQDAEHEFKAAFSEETEQRLIGHLSEKFGAIAPA
ncbi:MAG: hypothetical protein FJZ01_10850 [Candidatus Sericytochromatia bacterium]|nr:hypothetical protein [Candidatus Tanganyikabacteria bacterium]